MKELDRFRVCVPALLARLVFQNTDGVDFAASFLRGSKGIGSMDMNDGNEFQNRQRWLVAY